MKLFKNSVTNTVKKLGWKDISVRQFDLIQKAIEIKDETERIIEIVSVVFGEDVLDLPIAEFQSKVNQLKFLSEKLPEVSVKKKYVLNGTTYILDSDLSRMKASQYIDYTQLLKEHDMSKLLSVFLIPEGHSYNEGYDLEEVFKDMNELSIVDANSISFLFKRQLLAFIVLFQHYSIKKIKKMKITKEQKELLIDQIKTSALGTESLLTY